MAMIEIVLPGSIRSKKNSKRPVAIPARGKTAIYKRYAKKGLVPVRIIILPSTAYEAWEKEARPDAKNQLRKQGIFKPLEGPVHVSITVYFKGPRPDLSGCMESVGDCLEGIAWLNDRQIESDGINYIYHDLNNPRTIVKIYPLRR